ncbi:hypothetical protein L1987_46136 [Smallanthus sonchifolius]|uniref:Uncharacterized protein n=1 Tax=Smallanthus sonchifolius TaxID=185202 RepID=A0ACB9FZX8_9ASTR|nr:hypothetical protein L1987_46136 [Smallanthus sonchifolius]
MDYVTPIITPIVKSLLVPVNTHLGFMVSPSIYVGDMRARITELDDAARDVHIKQVSNKANSLVVPHHVPKWLEEVKTIMETTKRIPTVGVGCFSLKTRYKIGKQSCDILKVIDRLMKEKAEMVWNHESIPLAMVTSPRPSTIHDDIHNQNTNIIYSRDLMFNDINRMSKEERSKVGDNMPIVPFPSSLTHDNLQRVRKIEFYKFPRVEAVFEIQHATNRDELVTTQQQLLLFPYLEHLRLEEMDMLSHVWKCSNWNEFFSLHKHQPLSLFQNLTTIKLESCKSIKYLFSPLMVELLSNLKEVRIIFCSSIEEVVSNRDDAGKDEEMMSSTSSNTTTALFPHLDIIYLLFLGNLKHIGGRLAKDTTNFSRVHVSWSLCEYSTEIHICYCDALSSVIPYYATGRMQKLQVLSIEQCRSMVEIFETTKININNISGRSSTLATPSPRNILVHKLPNLKILNISDCDCLENIFTFSTLESLTKLEKLIITNCKSMKVIVKEEYAEQTTTSSKDVIFPHLKSIKLDRLPNLAGFFLGMNIDFHWPLLDEVMISYCPQMVVFIYGHSIAPRLKYIHTELGKHNHECCLNFHVTSSSSLDSISLHPTIPKGTPWSFYSLIECKLERHNLQKVFPSDELQLLEKLETINARYCSNVKEVFEVALEMTNNESQTVVKFPKLREVYLGSLSSLKYIWKSNKWRILEFPNLTRLSIFGCISLEHVFTCSMVRCVMQLQEIHIRDCWNMKVVVKEEEYDAKVSEIMFPCLTSLKLESFLSLEGFCLGKEDFTFPSLDTLVIKGCPRIMVFIKGHSIAPKLTTVETSFGSFNGGEDVNSFIMTEKEETPSTSLDGISSHPTISKRRPLPFHNLIKCNLDYNYKHTKIFASNELQQLQKLETIHAEECSYVEEVFEVALEMTNDESHTVVKIPKLTEMKLEYLPRLYYIWKNNQWRTLEFPNLTTLSINNCGSLEHVFTCSMVGCVMQLQELHIEECRNMKVIVKTKEEKDFDAKVNEINFPRLKSLRLDYLKSLKGFCLGKEDFTLPCLDTLVIKECSQITVFTRGCSIAPKLTLVETGFGSFVVGEDINSFIMAKKQLVSCHYV